MRGRAMSTRCRPDLRILYENRAAAPKINVDDIEIVRPRILYRPRFGGWGARAWRREVCEWLALAALVVASWACLNLLVGAVELLSH